MGKPTPSYGKTSIVLCEDAEDLGARAAAAVAECLRGLLREKALARVVFAAGESQMTFLDSLANERGIPWERVVCFNMDDFHDPRMPAAFSCGYQTKRQLYDRVDPSAYHLVRSDAPDPEAEAKRFEELLRANFPLDIVCQGIGTSGHLAMNEPGEARFDDERLVRVVHLAEQSKRQLRLDPNFRGLGYIPEAGITMTIPALMTAPRLFTMVPFALKKPILTRVLGTEKPTPLVPATILHDYEGLLFVDRGSCPDALLAALL